MHMVTVILVGLAMGTTVTISRAKGAGDELTLRKAISNSFLLFLSVSLLMTGILLFFLPQILHILAVPTEAAHGTAQYLSVCFVGILFITAYNVICSIFRGLGDTKSPLTIVAIAGICVIAFCFLLRNTKKS